MAEQEQSNDFGAKILWIAQYLNVTPYGLAGLVNLKHPTLLSYTNRDIEPRMSLYTKFLKLIPNLNQYWFFLDDPNPLVEDPVKLVHEKERMEYKYLKKLEYVRDENVALTKELRAALKEGNYWKKLATDQKGKQSVKPQKSRSRMKTSK